MKAAGYLLGLHDTRVDAVPGSQWGKQEGSQTLDHRRDDNLLGYCQKWGRGRGIFGESRNVEKIRTKLCTPCRCANGLALFSRAYDTTDAGNVPSVHSRKSLND